MKSTLRSKANNAKISSLSLFKLFSISFSCKILQNFKPKSPLIYLYFIFPKIISNFATELAKSVIEVKSLSIYISLRLFSFSNESKSRSIGTKSKFRFSI